MVVPVEVRVGTRVIRKLVRTDSGESKFTIPTVGTAAKVMLDPENSILRKP